MGVAKKKKEKYLNPVDSRTHMIPLPQLLRFNVTQPQAQKASPVPVPWVWLLLSSLQTAAGLDTHSKETCSNTLKILT